MKKRVFGGLTKIEMDTDIQEFDLGEGLIIRRTYAHLFAPFMMAFSPPSGKYNTHGDVKTTKGGIGFDIFVEIEVPEVPEFKKKISSENLLWLIACLIRINHPSVLLSATCDISFSEVKNSTNEPTIFPVEFMGRIFDIKRDGKPLITLGDLNDVKNFWKSTAKLIITEPRFYSALRAFDDASIHGKSSSSMLNVWGAIEHLFSPNTGELRYRVSANLASYLEKPGEDRLNTFKELSKLYNERSTAAHTSKEIDSSAILNSYLILRRALIKIIEKGKLPTQEELERLIFCT